MVFCRLLLVIGSPLLLGLTAGDGPPPAVQRAAPLCSHLSSAALAAPETAGCLIPFGKYRGKRVTEVPRSYLEWVVREKVYANRPELIAALVSLKLLDTEEARPLTQTQPPLKKSPHHKRPHEPTNTAIAQEAAVAANVVAAATSPANKRPHEPTNTAIAQEAAVAATVVAAATSPANAGIRSAALAFSASARPATSIARNPSCTQRGSLHQVTKAPVSGRVPVLTLDAFFNPAENSTGENQSNAARSKEDAGRCSITPVDLETTAVIRSVTMELLTPYHVVLSNFDKSLFIICYIILESLLVEGFSSSGARSVMHPPCATLSL